jgi:hypothetical protein
VAQDKRPTLGAPSFNCPHCGALANQTWFGCLAKPATIPPKVTDPTEAMLTLHSIKSLEERDAKHAELIKHLEGYVSLGARVPESGNWVRNLNLSQCFSCNDFSLWLYNVIVFPREELLFVANEDMPGNIVPLFKEAASIVNSSPRGATALLRLCVQLLCGHLGETGENINKDIGSLVKKGLSPIIQQALDVLRVIGNSAVHPGQIDLADDRETAHTLFNLLNVIVETMISQPKHIEEMYLRLPETARAAIENRDVKKTD